MVAALEEAARKTHGEPCLVEARLAATPRWRPAMRALAEKGWVEAVAIRPPPPVEAAPKLAVPNESQARAIAAIAAAAGWYRAFLLDGVTGSGKTEVYLAVIDRLVRAAAADASSGPDGADAAKGAQALVLVPEIGLTPQLVARFREALSVPVAVMHSGMAAGERLMSWQAARAGVCRVIIGTRSAIFAPFARLALIVVDEEHDPSYKQQEGFRYSARDLALMRGSIESIPVVLGSATPSLETLHLTASGRCRRLALAERAAGARMPAIALHDVRRRPLAAGALRTADRGRRGAAAARGSRLSSSSTAAGSRRWCSAMTAGRRSSAALRRASGAGTARSGACAAITAGRSRGFRPDAHNAARPISPPWGAAPSASRPGLRSASRTPGCCV